MAALTTPQEKSPLSIEAERIAWDFAPLPADTAEEIAIQRTMLDEAKRFLSDILAGAEPRWLVLLGRPGCGKTHLADKIRWFLRDNAQRIYETTVRPQIDPAGSSYTTAWSYAQEGGILAKWDTIAAKAKSGDYSMLRMAERDWCKVIDDLGVNSFSDRGQREPVATTFSVQIIGSVLDARLRKWTVITSNFSQSEFARQFDTRIASRLMRDNNVIVDCFRLRDFGLRKRDQPQHIPDAA